MQVALILANSADPDEMQYNAAFQLDLHCLPKLLKGVSSIQRSTDSSKGHHSYHILTFKSRAVLPKGKSESPSQTSINIVCCDRCCRNSCVSPGFM